MDELEGFPADDREPTPAQRLILVVLGFGGAALLVIVAIFLVGFLFS